MPAYRNRLPQLSGGIFATDGGLETTLIFENGLPLPEFAAFHLLRDDAGTEVLRKYFDGYAALAREHGLGFVLESPTWRANPDWAAQLGYDARALGAANRKAIDLMTSVRSEWEQPGMPFVISGNIGPRGDGYVASRKMTAREARDYHAPQIATFADTAADMVAAFTMNHPEEAIGVALAARDHGMPSVISFTVETDGRLPSGDRLADAIERTDQETGGAPAYYMINCAHPSHFEAVLQEPGPWDRVRGLRANASRRSHAELDGSSDLDSGDPEQFGDEHKALRENLPRLTVFGGCCGTDIRHVAAICSRVAASR
jgi:S-methylmethionine-dependent homocysteine/selenocysteine methylase